MCEWTGEGGREKVDGKRWTGEGGREKVDCEQTQSSRLM